MHYLTPEDKALLEEKLRECKKQRKVLSDRIGRAREMGARWRPHPGDPQLADGYGPHEGPRGRDGPGGPAPGLQAVRDRGDPVRSDPLTIGAACSLRGPRVPVLLHYSIN